LGFSGIKTIIFILEKVGKINNRKIKGLIVKETSFGIYFVLKRVWKINYEMNRGMIIKDLGFI
jgi:hypothetical protein